MSSLCLGHLPEGLRQREEHIKVDKVVEISEEISIRSTVAKKKKKKILPECILNFARVPEVWVPSASSSVLMLLSEQMKHAVLVSAMCLSLPWGWKPLRGWE